MRQTGSFSEAKETVSVYSSEVEGRGWLSHCGMSAYLPAALEEGGGRGRDPVSRVSLTLTINPVFQLSELRCGFAPSAGTVGAGAGMRLQFFDIKACALSWASARWAFATQSDQSRGSDWPRITPPSINRAHFRFPPEHFPAQEYLPACQPHSGNRFPPER